MNEFGLADDDEGENKASSATTSSSCSPSDESLGLCEDTASAGLPLTSAQQDLKDKEEQVLGLLNHSHIRDALYPAELMCCLSLVFSR